MQKRNGLSSKSVVSSVIYRGAWFGVVADNQRAVQRVYDPGQSDQVSRSQIALLSPC
jgi:hypothetical protein